MGILGILIIWSKDSLKMWLKNWEIVHEKVIATDIFRLYAIQRLVFFSYAINQFDSYFDNSAAIVI